MMKVMMILMMIAVTVMARGAIRNIGNGGIDGGQSIILLLQEKPSLQKLSSALILRSGRYVVIIFEESLVADESRER